MKIVAMLRRYQRPGTEDWVGEGTIASSDPLIGPARAYADADSAAAAAHGNPGEDPERPFGDHPFGAYDVVAVACPLCHSNLDTRQTKMGLTDPVPVLYFTQLMAVAFGMASPK